MTFREIAAATGESIDTLKARKRYALRSLARALRHWIDQ
jgi:DNA-directed RNA polymerase specialized sigma24 family protein